MNILNSNFCAYFSVFKWVNCPGIVLHKFLSLYVMESFTNRYWDWIYSSMLHCKNHIMNICWILLFFKIKVLKSQISSFNLRRWNVLRSCHSVIVPFFRSRLFVLPLLRFGMGKLYVLFTFCSEQFIKIYKIPFCFKPVGSALLHF